MRSRCRAKTAHGSESVRMNARSVWFRETGEGRLKEQFLIETMFCIYYLGKRSAVRTTRGLHFQPSFLNTFSSSVPFCGSRTSSVGYRQCVSRPARQPSQSTQPLVSPAMFDPHVVELDFRVMAKDARVGATPRSGLARTLPGAMTKLPVPRQKLVRGTAEQPHEKIAKF